MNISFREMTPGEAGDVVNLVLDVFSEFVGPDFSDEGISEFKKSVNVPALVERSQSGRPVIVAELEKEIVGVVEIRDNSHIALLFVKKTCQQKGIGKKLIREAVTICRKRNAAIRKITVNASPNAYSAYRKIGFQGDNVVKTKNGIRFIPLELALDHGADGESFPGHPGT